MAVALIESGKYAEARKEIDIALGYNQQHSAALKNLRLVSELDGKPAEINLPSHGESRLARMRGAWKRLWASGANSQSTNDSGSALGSQ